jgi:hypothetical protein
LVHTHLAALHLGRVPCRHHCTLQFHRYLYSVLFCTASCTARRLPWLRQATHAALIAAAFTFSRTRPQGKGRAGELGSGRLCSAGAYSLIWRLWSAGHRGVPVQPTSEHCRASILQRLILYFLKKWVTHACHVCPSCPSHGCHHVSCIP